MYQFSFLIFHSFDFAKSQTIHKPRILMIEIIGVLHLRHLDKKKKNWRGGGSGLAFTAVCDGCILRALRQVIGAPLVDSSLTFSTQVYLTSCNQSKESKNDIELVIFPSSYNSNFQKCTFVIINFFFTF